MLQRKKRMDSNTKSEGVYSKQYYGSRKTHEIFASLLSEVDRSSLFVIIIVQKMENNVLNAKTVKKQ